ncbi:hypothetical protein [Chryseobacterium sp. SIMBA_038]|uniref:hypothetical protein n=2 Tax=Pseudomonadati TaxID=3379134 RepID=UPI00397B2D02
MKDIVKILSLICLVAQISCSIKNEEIPEKEMKNNVEFVGNIISFQKSSNHAFGIIRLKIIKKNIKNFDEILDKGIYPYKIKDKIAELYCTVSVDRKVGETVKVVSNDGVVYYNPSNSREEGSLFIIDDPYNIDFVKMNTIFR